MVSRSKCCKYVTQITGRQLFIQEQQFVDTGPRDSHIAQDFPLVLLHGFCESHLIFDHLLPSLAEGCRVICPDMPGHGGRPWDKRWQSLSDAACWLRDFLDAQGIRKCVLVGHSLGGYIAANFAALFPERLAGLGMLHSTALPDAAARRELRTKVIEFVEAHGKEVFLQSFVRSLFHDPLPRWLQEMDAITAKTDVDAIVALTRIMRDRPDRTAAIAAVKVPVMYITGDHDSLVSAERTQQECSFYKIALLHRISDASHMSMYEAPEKVIAAMQSLYAACL